MGICHFVGVMCSSLGQVKVNVNFSCTVLCADFFALKLHELLRRSWQMFVFMLEKECLTGINISTYFRQRNGIVACLFYH